MIFLHFPLTRGDTKVIISEPYPPGGGTKDLRDEKRPNNETAKNN